MSLLRVFAAAVTIQSSSEEPKFLLIENKIRFLNTFFKKLFFSNKCFPPKNYFKSQGGCKQLYLNKRCWDLQTLWYCIELGVHEVSLGRTASVFDAQFSGCLAELIAAEKRSYFIILGTSSKQLNKKPKQNSTVL